MRGSFITALSVLCMSAGVDNMVEARKVRDPHSPFVGQHAGSKIITREGEGMTIALEQRKRQGDNRHRKHGAVEQQKNRRTKPKNYDDLSTLSLEEYMEHTKSLGQWAKELIYGKNEPFPERKQKSHRLKQSYRVD